MIGRVAVIGGGGRTGSAVCRRLLADGREVLAVVRDPARPGPPAGAEVAAADLATATEAALARTLAGCAAVVLTAGSTTGDFDAVDRRGTATAVAAARAAGVGRLVLVSALGAAHGTTPPALAGPYWDGYYAAKRAAEESVRGSGIPWTILQPGRLHDGGGTGRVALSQGTAEIADLSRADLAETVLAVLDDPRTAGRTWEVVEGPTPVADALAS